MGQGPPFLPYMWGFGVPTEQCLVYPCESDLRQRGGRYSAFSDLDITSMNLPDHTGPTRTQCDVMGTTLKK